MTDAARSPVQTSIRRLKVITFIVCCLPALWVGFQAFSSFNPVETAIRGLGDWGLRLILLTLAITPFRLLTGWGQIMAVRRMVGLFAFGYVALHLLTYFGADLGFDPVALWQDVLKRVYITIGMAAFLLMLPMAITSTNRMVQRLGPKAWKRLHKAIYLIAVLGVAHHALMIKAGYDAAILHGAILAVLLALRLILPEVKAARRRAAKLRGSAGAAA